MRKSGRLGPCGDAKPAPFGHGANPVAAAQAALHASGQLQPNSETAGCAHMQMGLCAREGQGGRQLQLHNVNCLRQAARNCGTAEI